MSESQLLEKPRGDPLAMAQSSWAANYRGSNSHNKKQRLRRSLANLNKPAAPSQMIDKVLRSPGQPLDRETREFMEPRFGRDFSRVKTHTPLQSASLTTGSANDSHEREADRAAQSVMHAASPQGSAPTGYDFSEVRIHSDPTAAESARAVNARAYTVGQHIVFGSGQYAPGTGEGRMLLAHELAHTVQQVNGMQRLMLKSFKCSDYAGDLKLEACLNDQDRLRPGERGPSVAKVQRGLMRDGVSVGPKGDDGIYGDATGQGVMAFKKKHNLGYTQYPDVGPGTMGKLDELCNAGTTPGGGGPKAQPEPRSAPDVLNLRTIRPGLISPVLPLQPDAESSELASRYIVPRIAPVTIASPYSRIKIMGQVSAEVKLDSEGDFADPCRLAQLSTNYTAAWKMKGYGIGRRINVFTEVSGQVSPPSGCEHLPEFELAANLLNYELVPESIQLSVRPLLTFGRDIEVGVSTEAEYKLWGGSNNFFGNISLTGSIGMKSQVLFDGSTRLFSPIAPDASLKATIEFNGL